MEIVLRYRVDYYKGLPVETYARSVHRELEAMGHKVFPVGEGHPNKSFTGLSPVIQRGTDLFLDVDCGRNNKGKLHFEVGEDDKLPKGTHSAVWYLDSHGYPVHHKRLSKKYSHVFFAVWDKRDLFKNHPSAHWLPCASDAKWFNWMNHSSLYKTPRYTVGFFGSKGGLSRADDLKQICTRNTYSYDIREVGKGNKHRWPRTAEAMINCAVLFNKGQKHDGPNQRVFESMLCGRPLITDRDNRSGLEKIFSEGEHFLGYSTKTELALQLKWCVNTIDQANDMAFRAYHYVLNNHQIKNRVEKIIECCMT